jgi:hypothetical protein
MMAGMMVLAVAAVTHGALVEESFDYTVGSALAGLNGGSGFGGEWDAWSDGLTTTIESGSLGLGDLLTSGNKLLFDRDAGPTFQGLAAARPVGVTITPDVGNTLYQSFLFEWEPQATGATQKFFAGVASHGDLSGLGSGIQPAASGHEMEVQVVTDGNPTTTPKVRTISAGSGDVDSTINSNQVYLAVASFDNIGSGTNNQTGTLWIFDTADAVNAILGTNDTTVLDTNALGKAVLNGGNGHAFDPTKFIKLAGDIGGAGGEFDMRVDELRYDSELPAVLPAIPEPASVALLGLGGLAMLARRRSDR